MKPLLVVLGLLALLAGCGGHEDRTAAPARDELVGTAEVERLLVGTRRGSAGCDADWDFRQLPFVAVYRNGSWSGRDLTPGAGSQWPLAVTAAGGRGTVLAASDASDRLYAVADLYGLRP